MDWAIAAAFVCVLLFCDLPAFAVGGPVVAEGISPGEFAAQGLDRCRERDEIVPDAEYERLLAACREEEEDEGKGSGESLDARLDEVELYTFWAIDGYLGDSVKLQTAQGLLNGCESDAKRAGLWDEDARLTGRCLYLRGSILMLEAYRLSQLPKFEELLPLLERSRVLLSGAREEILALNALGRAYADLAFADETSEARYDDLLEQAERAFREALALSDRWGGFMRAALMAQLGNTLNNRNEVDPALDMLNAALRRVDPSDQPNRFLALHLDIAQALTARYVETQDPDDLQKAEDAASRAFLISNSLISSHIVPHVRFNLAMTLFTIAVEKHDPEFNNRAILEIEKVLDAWPFERYTNLHLMAADTLCRFLDVQESLTREVRFVDRAIEIILGVMPRFRPAGVPGSGVPNTGAPDEVFIRAHGAVVGNLYGRLSDLYFKRALHETGERQKKAYDLSEAAAKRARELKKSLAP